VSHEYTVEATADRMELLYENDAHMHASYNAMNNHGKNDEAWQFWTSVCAEIRARNAKKRAGNCSA
jgi:hypothetical protein